MTPMERTLKLFRERGYEVGIVERWLSGAHIRSDLFGFIDAIAMNGLEIVGIQVCGADFAPHLRKILEFRAETARQWISSGGGLVLVGWTQKNSRKPPFRAKFAVRERWFGPQDFKSEKST